MIKHLVISGGGPTLIQMLAAIQELETGKYIERKNIQSIYGTSAGAILAVLFSLHMDWNSINDYILKRPWHEVFSVKIEQILGAYSKKGVFDHAVIEKCLKPLLDAKNLSIEITLEEFYQYSGVEIHFCTFELNQFKLVDISCKTNPTLSLMKAIQMTCALPIMIAPVFLDEKCYIDGGVVSNYPLQFCVESHPADEILGFKNEYEKSTNHIHSESTLFNFLTAFLVKLINSINIPQPTIKNEIIFKTPLLSIDELKKAFSSIDVRKELFKNGMEAAKEFME